MRILIVGLAQVAFAVACILGVAGCDSFVMVDVKGKAKPACGRADCQCNPCTCDHCCPEVPCPTGECTKVEATQK